MELTSKPITPTIKPRALQSIVRNKYLVWADWKHGKTSFAASVIAWWKENGWPPETCHMAFLDCDDGLEPLVAKGIIPEEYLQSVAYYPVRDFSELREATRAEIRILRAHAQEHGVDRAWLVVDNMEASWEWTRDHYAIMTHGMSETEIAAQKRKNRVESGEANKTTPTFSPHNDYSIITPMHNDWADSIKFSGISFMWLTPQKATKKDFFDEKEIPELGPSGQKSNPGRVDHIIRLWRKDVGDKPEYFADIVSSRTARSLVRRIPNPTFSLVKSLIEGKKPATAPPAKEAQHA